MTTTTTTKAKEESTTESDAASSVAVNNKGDDDNKNDEEKSSSSLTTTPSKFLLPKWTCPIPRSELEPIDKFVSDAIALRSGVLTTTVETTTNDNDNASTTSTTNTTSYPTYKALVETLRKKQDPILFLKVIIVLRTSNTLTLVTNQPSIHAQLLHYIFKTNPFKPSISVLKKMKQQQMMMLSLTNNQSTNVDTKQLLVQQQLHQKWNKYYNELHICDAYLQLIIAIVSANSIFVKPALTTIWKRLLLLYDVEEELGFYNDTTTSSTTLTNDAKTNKRQQEQHETTTSTTTVVWESSSDDDDDRLRRLRLDNHRNVCAKRLQDAIGTILRFIPTAGGELLSNIIHSTIPHVRTCIKNDEILWYLKQCWTLEESLQHRSSLFSSMIWNGIIEKCLQLDVEIKITDKGEALLLNDKDDDDKTTKRSLEEELEMHMDRDENGEDTNHKNKSGDPSSETTTAQKNDEITTSNNTTTTTTNTNNNKKDDDDDVNNELDELADKLDEILNVCFQYMKRRITSHEEQEKLYHFIMPYFESKILTTYKSKFVQFIIFVLCGYNNNNSTDSKTVAKQEHQPPIYRIFCEALIGIAYSSSTTANNSSRSHYPKARITRQAAVCYLASFVSRAKYVCSETVCEVIVALLKWAEAYMDAMNTTNASKQLKLLQETKKRKLRQSLGNHDDDSNIWETHSLFYTVCQGAFYIMCFRGKDAMEYYNNAVQYWKEQHEQEKTDEEEEDTPYLELEHVDLNPSRWARLVSSSTLKPLQFCLSSVRDEFLHVARVFQLLDESLIQELMDKPPATTTSETLTSTTPPSQKRRLKRRRLASTPIIRPGSSFGDDGKVKTTITTAKVTTKKKRRQSSSGGGIGGLGANASNPLDSFFPFDPYLLEKSFPYIEKYYRNWEGSIELEDDDDDEEEEGMSSPHGVVVDEEDLVVVDDDDDIEDHSSVPGGEKSGVADNNVVPPEEKKDSDDEEDDDTVESHDGTVDDDANRTQVVGNLAVVKSSAAWGGTVITRRPRGFSIESGGSW